MSVNRNLSKSGKNRRIQLAPMTRAVRSALAASAVALALGAGGAAAAANVHVSAPQMLQLQLASIDMAPVIDLSVVDAALSQAAVFSPLAIDVTEAGDINIDNADPITETNPAGATAIRGYSTGGNVSINNQAGADLVAYSSGSNAIGIYGYASSGDVSINNAAAITAVDYTGLADGIFASGAEVGVTNSGAITAAGGTWAAGIEAQGTGTTTIHNTGDIYAAAVASGGEAFGIYATGDLGVVLENAAAIEAQGYYATGIEVQSGANVSIENSGAITAGKVNGTSFYSALANGIEASSNGAGATVAITNSGDVNVAGFYGGTGIAGVATGEGGMVNLTNSGNVAVIQGTDNGYGAYGALASADGNASVTNSGSIQATSAGAASGASALSFAGDASVVNSGDITVTSTAFVDHSAYGIVSASVNGTASINNTGNVQVSTLYKGFGIDASGHAIDITSSGDVNVDAYRAFGIRAMGSNISVDNSGDIGITYTGAYAEMYPGRGFGIYAVGSQGDVQLNNTGSIAIDIGSLAIGVVGIASNGDLAISNGGSIETSNTSSNSLGIYARADAATANVTVTNSGDIHAASVNGNAIGIQAIGPVVEINNSGTITGASEYGAGVAVQLAGSGQNTLNNLAGGSLSASSTNGAAFAVFGGAGSDTINNAGTISGRVSLGAGDDVFNGQSGGLFDIGAQVLDMGAGNDTVNNAVGSVIRMDSGVISMGDGTGSETFENAGTVQSFGYSGVIMGGGTLVNNGVIDMVDGAADDTFVVIGNLAGNGSHDVDVDFSTMTSDVLVVAGNVASGSVQTVNVNFTGTPTAMESASVAFAQVQGAADAGALVGGEVLNWSASNFLDLDVNVSDDGAGTYALNVEVAGLNDTGTLAASTASGAANLMNAQVGSFRQRLGVNPYGDAGKVMSAFVRYYTDEGDVTQTHAASSFGNAGDFSYAQSNWGREVGVNANLFGNFHAGLVLGSANSRQRVGAAGSAENRMSGMTWGFYASWYVPKSFYVDLSSRSMNLDARLNTTAEVLESRVQANAKSVEVGYEWNIGNFVLVPQLQYTLTDVEASHFSGERLNFLNHGGSYSRGRLGVEISRSFQAGNLLWTPYASLNAVREFDGDSSYLVGDNFLGSTSIGGSSSMAELGLSVQKAGLGFNVGASWVDGGAYDSTVGVQAGIRYAW